MAPQVLDVAAASDPRDAVHRLPARVREAVVPSGDIRVRVPAHELVLSALRLLAGPVVMIGARRASDADAVTAEDVVSRLSNEVDVVLDDGRCKFAQRS